MFKSKLTKLLDTLKYYSCVRCDLVAAISDFGTNALSAKVSA